MPKVLIVDDSVLSRRSVQTIVDSLGYDHEEAADGSTAIKLLHTSQPDCIVLDLLMPVMSGKAVLKEINNRGISTPVIVVTADIQASTREYCEKMGVEAVLNKPIEEEELRHALTTALDAKK